MNFLAKNKLPLDLWTSRCLLYEGATQLPRSSEPSRKVGRVPTCSVLVHIIHA